MVCGVDSRQKTDAGGSEQGTVLIIVAFMLVSLLGFAGLTIDFGYYFVQKSRLQALVDSAALACGQFTCTSDGVPDVPDSQLLAPLVANQAVPGVTFQINARVACPNTAANDCVTVRATQEWNTFFMRLFAIPTLKVSAEATAVAGGGDDDEEVENFALYALGQNLLNWQSGIVFEGSNQGRMTIEGDVVSGAVGPSWSGSIVNNFDGSLNISGNVNATGDVLRISQSQLDSNDFEIKRFDPSPVTDPCSGKISPPKVDSTCVPGPDWTFCDQNNEVWTAKPNVTYCSWRINVARQNCEVRLPPGVFVVRDGIQVAGSANNFKMISEGSLIYVPSSSNPTNVQIHANGNNFELELNPMTSGPYAGISIWSAGTSGVDLTINQGAGADYVINGLVYAPSAPVTIGKNGNDGNIDKLVYSGVLGNSIVLRNNYGRNNNFDLLAVSSSNNVCGGGASGDDSGNGGGGGSGSNRLRLVR